MSSDDYVSEEYMSLVSVNRISGRNDQMFASDVPHNSWLELTVKKASVKRSLNQEWYSDEGTIVKVQFTNSKFSELVSNMNCGLGVPCTLKEANGKRMKRPDPIDRTGQFSEEFKLDMENVTKLTDDVINAMEELNNKTGASKKDKAGIINKLSALRQNLSSNMPFVEKQFRRCLVKATDDAKRNAEGHILNIALNAANRGLVTNQESDQISCEFKDCNLLEE